MFRLLARSRAFRNVPYCRTAPPRSFSGLPDHTIVPMPALSPTMESGSIANWLLKEGDAFEAGQAICEVETDKATVTYDATDDGYIAKILAGNGEIEVGTPLMITVEDSNDVAAFANYVNTSPSAQVSSQVSSLQSDELPNSQDIATPLMNSPSPLSSLSSNLHTSGERVIASPLARRLAREASISLGSIAALDISSGPHGRLIGDDVLQAVASGALSKITSIVDTSVQITPSSMPSASNEKEGASESCEQLSFSGSLSSTLGSLSTKSKKEIPHYYLSVEINIDKVLSLKESIGDYSVSVQDILIKAAAKAMEKVPAVNAAWMESCVRQYDQVDINVIIGEGSLLRAPVLRNVGGMGLLTISNELKNAYDQLEDISNNSSTFETGTFTIQNLGMYGVQAASAIVIPPQACALTFGAIVDTIIPNPSSNQGEEVWKVAPIMVSTLSCDHRVIDGAVGAGWLKAFKEYAENPLTLLL